MIASEQQAVEKIAELSRQTGIAVAGAAVRRSSSRFCLGVEHGDYNGTELFGVGTDRFIWLAYKPTTDGRVRLFSGNFPGDGVIDFKLGEVPDPGSAKTAHSWARFPFGVDYVLGRAGYTLKAGIEGIVYGNIPGGGMSRSASLTLNLILTLLEVNAIAVEDPFKIVDLAQAVENQYIGSPCGQLDQIMILFARENMGTHYNPADRTIRYVPLGPGGENLRLVVLDTGTDRPGLEKSTYKIRRGQCEQFVALLQKEGYDVKCLADVRTESMYKKIESSYAASHPDLFARLNYIYHAQQRFGEMLSAWEHGDVAAVGRIFRRDGLGLRDDYQISGPELETLCDIARTVPGVLGERMLGGGDKGAAGAIVDAGAVDSLRQAVSNAYPRSRPQFADKFAIHNCKIVEGIKTITGLF
jgi:galactokinase